MYQDAVSFHWRPAIKWIFAPVLTCVSWIWTVLINLNWVGKQKIELRDLAQKAKVLRCRLVGVGGITFYGGVVHFMGWHWTHFMGMWHNPGGFDFSPYLADGCWLEVASMCVCWGEGKPKVSSSLKPLELQCYFAPFQRQRSKVLVWCCLSRLSDAEETLEFLDGILAEEEKRFDSTDRLWRPALREVRYVPGMRVALCCRFCQIESTYVICSSSCFCFVWFTCMSFLHLLCSACRNLILAKLWNIVLVETNGRVRRTSKAVQL